MKHFMIGSRIRASREAAGLSKAELARRIGATPQQIALYEADRRNMSVERFARICEALCADMVEMISEKKRPDA